MDDKFIYITMMIDKITPFSLDTVIFNQQNKILKSTQSILADKWEKIFNKTLGTSVIYTPMTSEGFILTNEGRLK